MCPIAASRLAAGSEPTRICTRPTRKRAGAAIGRDTAAGAAGCQSDGSWLPLTARGAGIRGEPQSRMPRMDMSYTPEEEAFRARVREWLEQNVPPPGSLTDDLEAMRAWQRKLHSAGLLAVSWPKEYGGAGLSPMEQAILNEELARVRAPGVVNAMAIWWVGPAIMRYGTDAQKQRFIPKILDAEEIWATGYSEPSSGSDMAAAKTRAERRGDYYVVNGQKIWTTLAHISDWYFVLVRTSNESKWGGLSLLL